MIRITYGQKLVLSLKRVSSINRFPKLNPGNWQPPGTEAAGVIAENFTPQKFGGAHQYRNYINITDIEARAQHRSLLSVL